MRPRLFRRRYVPDELVELADDEIVLLNEDVVVTRWKPLRPRADFAAGASCAFIRRGFKISALYDGGGALLKYYCDVIDTVKDGDSYIFRDLLADVVVEADGAARVLDLDELADAAETGLLTAADVAKALRGLDGLLQAVYDGEFAALTETLAAPLSGI